MGSFKGIGNRYIPVAPVISLQRIISKYQLSHMGVCPEFGPLTSGVGGECYPLHSQAPNFDERE